MLELSGLKKGIHDLVNSGMWIGFFSSLVYPSVLDERRAKCITYCVQVYMYTAIEFLIVYPFLCCPCSFAREGIIAD